MDVEHPAAVVDTGRQDPLAPGCVVVPELGGKRQTLAQAVHVPAQGQQPRLALQATGGFPQFPEPAQYPLLTVPGHGRAHG